MIDELDTHGDADTTEQGADIRANLRNELFSLMTSLQFQDITTQQLNYAASVLMTMEERLAEIANIFDPDGLGPGGLVGEIDEPMQPAFDPAATGVDVEERQALADAFFAGR
jgi:hypothetical protein